MPLERLMKYELLMKRLMVESEIYGIAAKNGWRVSVSVENGVHCYDFQRRTLSGVAFSFTAEVKDDEVSSLESEIVSFVDAINPVTCAWEWMIKSGAMDSSRYLQAVADMEDIRSKAWLLACDLSELSGEKPIWSVFTKNGLN
ncbi:MULTISPECIES: hypothetical protein [Bacteroides]|nr:MULTISPECIES: hypothetical protein [Bacteroides]